MNVALVYDRINKWGGAERVLLALHELYPNATLYTSVYNEGKAEWAKVFKIKSSFLQKFPFAKETHELYPLLMPQAFESFSFDEYDLVISVTSEAAKGIITKPSTLHICYCLTPTRYLWSGYNDYFKNGFMKVFASPALSYLRAWDKIASHRPDKYIAISQEVKNRILKYYGKDAEIIHPPVGLFESVRPTVAKKEEGKYYLVVSRLVAYKRIDLAIKACNTLSLPLKIVGTGVELERLKKIAGPTIEFLGAVSDEDLIPLYQKSRALLFPGFEDFGIVMVEALGLGTPVIAYKQGGALDIIEDGKSGVLFQRQSVASLIEGIHRLQLLTFDPKIMRKRADFFAKEEFKKKFVASVGQTLQKKKISL